MVSGHLAIEASANLVASLRTQWQISWDRKDALCDFTNNATLLDFLYCLV